MSHPDNDRIEDRADELAEEADCASEAAVKILALKRRDWAVIAVACQRARDAWEAMQLWAWSMADEERERGDRR